MTLCNYLQGDLFERFYSNNLPTPSYILWSTQFNCALCVLTQWNSTRCGWWMLRRLHRTKIICILVTIHRLVSIPRCSFSSQLWRARLCLSSCLWFSQDQNCTVLSSAWPSVAMETHGSWDRWRVRKAWHRLNQKNYLFTLHCCLYPYHCRTLCYLY